MTTGADGQDTNISFEWQRGFAAGINVCISAYSSQFQIAGKMR